MSEIEKTPPAQASASARRAGILLALVAASAGGGCNFISEMQLQAEDDQRKQELLQSILPAAPDSMVENGSEGEQAQPDPQTPPPDPQNPQHPPL